MLPLGLSSDHRRDLAQLKVALAPLNPLGMSLATEELSSGNADDPMYLPIIACMYDGLKLRGLLYVEDGKMAPLQTRASIQAH